MLRHCDSHLKLNYRMRIMPELLLLLAVFLKLSEEFTSKHKGQGSYFHVSDCRHFLAILFTYISWCVVIFGVLLLFQTFQAQLWLLAVRIRTAAVPVAVVLEDFPDYPPSTVTSKGSSMFIPVATKTFLIFFCLLQFCRLIDQPISQL